jgi:hypothetical protein
MLYRQACSQRRLLSPLIVEAEHWCFRSNFSSFLIQLVAVERLQ